MDSLNSATKPGDANTSATDTITVVIVDDHPLVRLGLEQLLSEEKDIEVAATASTAKTGIKSILKHKPSLAIVDLTLEDGNGLQVVDYIQRKQPSTKILILSMHDEETFGSRCYEAGAKGYVSKRLAPTRVPAALRHIASGGTCFGDATMEHINANFTHVECKCGNKVQAPKRFAGKKVKCPACAAPVLVTVEDVNEDEILEILGDATQTFDTADITNAHDTNSDVEAAMAEEANEASPEQRCPSCGYRFRGSSSMCPKCHKFVLDLSNID